MTNEQKYKTPDERIKAFDDFCKGQGDRCNHCEIARKRLSISRRSECVVYWLALEAEEEKPEPCPFCGEKVEVCSHGGERDRLGNVYLSLIRCPHCGYTSSSSSERDSIGGIIAAHNRVARAVRQ